MFCEETLTRHEGLLDSKWASKEGIGNCSRDPQCEHRTRGWSKIGDQACKGLGWSGGGGLGRNDTNECRKVCSSDTC